MRPRLLHTALAAAATAVAVSLAGCAATGPSPAGPPSTPLSDRVLTVYSGRDEKLVQPLIDAFEKKSGIQVDVRYGGTSELSALLTEEGDRTPAQVFLSQDAGSLGALSKAGLFGTLPADIANAVSAGFTSTDKSWVGITGRARAIVYDSQKLTPAQVPASVEAFADPQWSGRFGIAPGNSSFQAFVTAYRVIKGEEAAAAWIAAVAANKPQIFENNRAILAAVNDGVIDAGLINHYYWYAQAKEVGRDTMRAQLSFPRAGDPGSIVNVTGAGVLKAAAGDADALEFIRFLLSPASQSYFADTTFEYPLAGGVAAPNGLPALDTLVNPDLDLSDLDSLETTQQLLSRNGLI